jgi:6-pyruvoyl-tetrahydropterin synthase
VYRATVGIHAQFAHHVRGHSGPCISLHGHTWKLELRLEARSLDPQGFVVDFDLVHERALLPAFRLLDHSLALGAASYAETETLLAPLGERLIESRRAIHGGLGARQESLEGELGGARNVFPGGIKVALFLFTPTSESLAEWLHRVGSETFADDRVRVHAARVYESLHPVETFAEYVAD